MPWRPRGARVELLHSRVVHYPRRFNEGLPMNRTGFRFSGARARVTISLVLLVIASGCGMIADKDRIRIAKVNDDYITRGDLYRVLREMPDDERPAIRNKGDLLRALNTYIDEQVKAPLVPVVEQQLGQGKELVPRQAAAQRFFAEHPDDNFEVIYQIQDPAAVDMTQAELDFKKQEIELRIDRVLDKLKADAAVMYTALNAYKNKELVIEDREFEQEYGFRKDTLKTLEWMKFRAIRFPEFEPDSERGAADVRRRLDAGETFDAVFNEMAAKKPSSVIESEIENNPGLERFRGFWMSASGAEKGAVLGPLFLPEYQVMAEVQGRRASRNMPAAYLAIEVLDHKPERTLTLDEAKPKLAPTILVSKMMQRFREQNGVEIYEDKLPDPSLFVDRFGQSTVPM
jgi:hypothetical protein